MRIALDAQLTVGTATGIGEYVRGLSGALRDAGADVVELRKSRLDPWRFDRRVIWDQWLLPRHTAALGADVLHCASGTMPLARARKRDGSPVPVVVTVHDVAWLRAQTHAKWYARKYFGSFSLSRYRSAARIVVDSEFSRSELLRVFADDKPAGSIPPIEVVYPGVAQEYCDIQRQRHSTGACRERSQLASAKLESRSDSAMFPSADDGAFPAILVIGTVEPRKNLAFLIGLLPRLPNARIVSVGPFTPYADACRALAARLGVADRVELRGYVPREEVLQLYATCAAVAVPSTYEGFGYALAQALCAGTPVVVSDRSSLPEVAGGDAPVIPLQNEDAWLEALRSALTGELEAAAQAARQDAIQRFSWSTAAQTMLRVYQSA